MSFLQLYQIRLTACLFLFSSRITFFSHHTTSSGITSHTCWILSTKRSIIRFRTTTPQSISFLVIVDHCHHPKSTKKPPKKITHRPCHHYYNEKKEEFVCGRLSSNSRQFLHFSGLSSKSHRKFVFGS